MEMKKNEKQAQMKKFTIRDLETVKTTAALYGGWCAIAL